MSRNMDPELKQAEDRAGAPLRSVVRAVDGLGQSSCRDRVGFGVREGKKQAVSVADTPKKRDWGLAVAGGVVALREPKGCVSGR